MSILVHQGDGVPNAYTERCECAGKLRPDVFAIQHSPVLACLGLQSVRGRASTQVSEGGAYSDAPSLQQLETGCMGDFPRFPEGLRFSGQLLCTCLTWYARRSDGWYTGRFMPLWGPRSPSCDTEYGLSSQPATNLACGSRLLQ